MATEVKIKVSADTSGFVAEMDKLGASAKSAQQELQSAAAASGAVFAAGLGTIAATTAAFAQYERALVGVGKTADIEGKQLQDLGKNIAGISKEIPIATTELLKLAQTGGQLGVKGSANIVKFTETLAKLQFTTDIVGEEGAASIARILNVTGDGIETVDRFGSVLVALGNNFAATESQIVTATTEVAAATAVFDVTAGQAAALGTAFASIGVQAQLGGSSVARTMRAIESAVKKGGKPLQDLALITGKTGKEIQKVFEEDSVEAFRLFLDGLDNVRESGGSVSDTLAQFGLQGEQINKTIPALAKNSDLLSKALKIQNEETENALALNKEAQKAFETLDAEFQLLKNDATAAATAIGEQFAPAVEDAIKKTRAFFNLFNEGTSESIATFIKWTTIISGAVFGLTSFLAIAVKVSAVVQGLIAAFTGASLAAGTLLATLTGPIGIAVAGVAAIAAGAVALNNAFDEKPSRSIATINKELEELNKSLEKNRKLAAVDPNQAIAVKNIEERIKKLNEERDAIIRNREEFGKGGGVLQEFEGTIPTREDVDFDPVAEAERIEKEKAAIQDKARKDEIQKEQEKNAIIDIGTKERIEEAQLAAEILKAEAQGLSEAEIQALRDVRAAEQELKEARLIENEELRELEIANAEDKLERFKEEQMLLAEARTELQEEEKAQLEEFEMGKNVTRKQAEEDFKKAQVKARKEQLKQTSAFHKQQDQLDQQRQRAAIGFAAATGDAIIALTGDNGVASLILSKSLALAQIAIDDGKARAAAEVAAATAAAQTPGPPPAQAVAFAAMSAKLQGAITANTALAVGTVAAQTVAAAARMQTGGTVPGTGTGDKTLILAEPGETVIPNTVAPTFEQAFSKEAIEEAAATQEGEGNVNVSIDTLIGEQEFVDNNIIPRIADAVLNRNADLGIER